MGQSLAIKYRPKTLEEICQRALFFKVFHISFNCEFILFEGISAAAIDWANDKNALLPSGPTALS